MSDEKQRYFRLKPLRVNSFIQKNPSIQEVTDPIFFNSNGAPTSKGLLSNEIFGISSTDRANTFAYISLGSDPFIHPLFYKLWGKMDGNIKACVHGTKSFVLNDKGELVEDENGDTGLTFLKKNINKIKIKSTESSKRENNIAFIEKYKELMFIENMIVIPAYYRDINSDGGYVGVGDINKLYNSLLIATKSLRESAEYGLSLADSVRGRIQEILVAIYDWFTSEPNLPGKRGIIRRANLSKTTDYSSRLVLSATDLKVEKMEDLLVDLDHTAVPLASAIANFAPYIIFYVRRFFENEFANEPIRTVFVKKGNDRVPQQLKMKDYQIVFSDTIIKEEMDRFIHGYSNRFRPVELPLENGKTVTLRFKGIAMTDKEYKDKNNLDTMPMQDRPFLWLDLFYMAAVEVTKDKTILITRYPIDSMYNQFPSKLRISSTRKTEPMVINGVLYQHYPSLKPDQIGTNTSNLFIDTLMLCNGRINSIGGDFDGDQVSIKSLFSTEANAELAAQLESKAHYIGLSGTSVVESSNEGLFALYSLTMVLSADESRLTQPVF